MNAVLYLLVQGRNTYCINVITEELKYLTWEEAFVCLVNEQLPDQLRAKYCSLIIGESLVFHSHVFENINFNYFEM